MKERIEFFLKTKKRSTIIILLFIFIILFIDSNLLLYLFDKILFNLNFDFFVLGIKIILSFILLLIIILKYQKDNKTNEEKDVEIIMVEGEYGVGKSYHVQENYVDNKKSKMINLYEESSEGNFLRDIYYSEFEIIINFIVVFLMLYSIYLSYVNGYYFIAILISILFLQEYFMYIVNFFIKFLILENKYYLNIIANNFSKYDYIVFEDIDRLNFNEQRELIKIISYLKFHLKKGKKIILVGNVKYIDNIFIDKYINKKEKVSKEKHFEEWVDQLSKLDKYPEEEINLMDEVLHLFTERINYRFFNGFLNYLKEEKYKDNLINCFIEFYIYFYLDVDINNPGLIKKTFDIYDIENIFGEIYYMSSIIISELKKLVMKYNLPKNYIDINIFEDKVRRDYGENIFKIKHSLEEEKEFVENDMEGNDINASKISNSIKKIYYVYIPYYNPRLEEFLSRIRKLSNEIGIHTYHEFKKEAVELLKKKNNIIDNITDEEIIDMIKSKEGVFEFTLNSK